MLIRMSGNYVCVVTDNALFDQYIDALLMTQPPSGRSGTLIAPNNSPLPSLFNGWVDTQTKMNTSNDKVPIGKTVSPNLKQLADCASKEKKEEKRNIFQQAEDLGLRNKVKQTKILVGEKNVTWRKPSGLTQEPVVEKSDCKQEAAARKERKRKAMASDVASAATMNKYVRGTPSKPKEPPPMADDTNKKPKATEKKMFVTPEGRLLT